MFPAADVSQRIRVKDRGWVTPMDASYISRFGFLEIRH
jgi:hypothetical protein